MIFNLSGSSSGGGGSERYITPTFPQYLQMYSTLTDDGSFNFLDTKAVGLPNETVYVKTNPDWSLVTVTREDTGVNIPFTTITQSTHYQSGVYSFVMPDANVTYDLHYDD